MAENNGRRQAYKNFNKNNDELRMRRHEVTIELRKSKKDEQLLKRRNIGVDDDYTSPVKDHKDDGPKNDMSITEICEHMRSIDSETRYHATQSARRLLSSESNPPIDAMIAAGVVPLCVEFLMDFQHPTLQFEAAWALTNIASGTTSQTATLIAAGGVAPLVKLLRNDTIFVVEQCVWALGNIAGDGSAPRDILFECGVLTELIPLISTETPTSLLRNIVWLISNLCRNKDPAPALDHIKTIVPLLKKMLHFPNPDRQVLIDISWALSYITDGASDRIQLVIDNDCVPFLVFLLGSKEVQIIVPALRSVGNIVTGSDFQTEAVLNANVLPALANLLAHEKTNIVKEAVWSISNIAAGNPRQIQCIFDAGIIQLICKILENGDAKCQREAAWAITNITTSGQKQQVSDLLEKYLVLPPFCKLLKSPDVRAVKVVLDGLSNMFHMAEKVGNREQLCLHFEHIGALDKLEDLQNHENEEIYAKAYLLVETYFADQPDDEKENQLKPTVNGDSLKFSPNTQGSENGFNF